jgi:hypothetical protein
MRARDIVGKKVERVEQQRFWNQETHDWCVSLESLVFTDGTVLYFGTTETSSDYATTGHVFKKKKENR